MSREITLIIDRFYILSSVFYSIAKLAVTTAVTLFSSDVESLTPQSDTSVELMGVIWNTPILAERIEPFGCFVGTLGRITVWSSKRITVLKNNALTF